MEQANKLATSGVSLVDGIVATVRTQLVARTLRPGSKLPSIRRMAQSSKTSKSTVVEAYDRLAAEGVIEPRRGSGFYVVGHAAPLSLSNHAPRPDREVDPMWISRQALEADDIIAKPGCGWLPADWMPDAGIRRGLRQIARSTPASIAEYTTPMGFGPLRQLLARRLADYNIEAGADQIMLTDSGTQAVDLLCRLLLEPGDTVLVDDPCYFNFLALLRAHRVNVVGIPFTPNGPDVAAFERALVAVRPRLYITNTALHNPTGATISPVVAHRILKLAEQADLTIIEDDIFGDFEGTPSPRLAAFDGLQRVVHVGSFSKTLSASVRCGYIAARRDWIEGLVDLKIATTFGNGRLAAELVFKVLSDGAYRHHMSAVRERLSRALGSTSVSLRSLELKPWVEPRAGMFLWCELPGNLDATSVARQALVENVLLAPGNAFSVSQSAGRFLRFNVSQPLDRRLLDVLRKCMR